MVKARRRRRGNLVNPCIAVTGLRVLLDRVEDLRFRRGAVSRHRRGSGPRDRILPNNGREIAGSEGVGGGRPEQAVSGPALRIKGDGGGTPRLRDVRDDEGNRRRGQQLAVKPLL